MAGSIVVANAALGSPPAGSANSSDVKPRPVATPTSGSSLRSSMNVGLKLSDPPLEELMT